MLENIFHLKENHTDVKTELMAGVTTFMTMAYILAVNPSILSASGMDANAVLIATSLASFVGTALMALLANYPFALAPGMGLNAYFAYTVVLTMGYSWQLALMAVFVEGIIFIVLSLTNVREGIFNAIPMTLKSAVSVGIGLFAIPVANELLGGSKTAEWALVIVAGICMTASAYFGIKSLTIVSYIAVPMVAVLGTVAMVLAVMRGDGTIVDQFAKSSGTLTVIGGAGLVVGSFVSGGTATPNFSRFAKSGKVGAITTVIAFFIGNSLMFFFGGVSSVYVGGNDIFEVMINLGLFYLAILVLGLNIWTTNDNALYSAGLGLANIFGQKKKPMVLVAGIIGTVLAVWLYWNFCGLLNILNCTLPPVGIILVIGVLVLAVMLLNRLTGRK